LAAGGIRGWGIRGWSIPSYCQNQMVDLHLDRYDNNTALNPLRRPCQYEYRSSTKAQEPDKSCAQTYDQLHLHTGVMNLIFKQKELDEMLPIDNLISDFICDAACVRPLARGELAS